MSLVARSILSTGWRPPWRTDPAAGRLVAGLPAGVLSVLVELPRVDERSDARRWIAQWLEAWVASATADIEDDEVSFVYVVLRRLPEATDRADGTIAAGTPVAEAGMGSAPSASDEWDVVPARVLVRMVAGDLTI